MMFPDVGLRVRMPRARYLQFFSAAVQILMYSYGSGAAGCLFTLRGRRSTTRQFRLESLAAKVRQLCIPAESLRVSLNDM